MTGAIEKLIEAAEVVLPIIDRDTDAVNALRNAIAPARAEWEKVQKLHVEGTMRLMERGKEMATLHQRAFFAEKECDRLRAELAAARATDGREE